MSGLQYCTTHGQDAQDRRRHPNFSLGSAHKEVPSYAPTVSRDSDHSIIIAALCAGAGLQPMTSLVDANSHTPSMNTLEINAPDHFVVGRQSEALVAGCTCSQSRLAAHDLQRSRTDEVFDSHRLQHG